MMETNSILNNFYVLNSYESEENIFRAAITLNKNHEIFRGHFPGNPVTPGVCMLQIVKDLTEKFTDSKLFLKSASNVKFMAIINPFETPHLVLEIKIDEKDGAFNIKSTTSFGETIALKLSATYTRI